MRPISFGDVLRNKGKSVRVQTRVAHTLSDLVCQFELEPYQDYTLYLGNGTTLRSKSNSFNVLSSKNSQKQTQDMFDSWIKKQTLLDNQKGDVYKRNLKKINKENEIHKGAKKIILTAKGNNTAKSTNRTSEVEFRQLKEQKPYNQRHSNDTNLINSNQYSRNDVSSSFESKGVNQCFNQTNNKHISKNQKFIRPTALPYIEDANSVNYEKKNRPSKQEELNEIIASTEHIYTEIGTIAHNILEKQWTRHQQQELLIDDSNITKENQEQIQKKRWEAAKNKVGGYLKSITKAKESMDNCKQVELSYDYDYKINNSPQKQDLVGNSLVNRQFQMFSQQKQDNTQIPPLQFKKYTSKDTFVIPFLQQIVSERVHLGQMQPIQNQIICDIEKNRIDNNDFSPNQYVNSQSPDKCDYAETIPHYQNSHQLKLDSQIEFKISPEMRRSLSNQNEIDVKQSLSYTEQKPEIIVKIPSDYDLKEDFPFNLQTVEIHHHCESQNNINSSPSHSNISQSPSYRKSDKQDDLIASPANNSIKSIEVVSLNRNSIEENSGLKIVQQNQQAEFPQERDIQFQQFMVNLRQDQQSHIQNNNKNMEQRDTFTFILPSIQQSNFHQTSQIQNKLPSIENQIHPITINILANIPSTQLIKPDSMETLEVNVVKLNTNCGNSPSNNFIGLKKVYSSPKTIQPIMHTAPYTSGFTTQVSPQILVPQKQSTFATKEESNWPMNNFHSKIDSLAYNSKYTLKQFLKEPPKQEKEQFQFDF